MAETHEGAVKPSSIEKDTYEQDLFAQRSVDIPSNMQMRVAYDVNSNATHVGYAPRGLASSATGWLLQKFTYDVSNRCTLRQIAYDSWDNAQTTAVYA